MALDWESYRISKERFFSSLSFSNYPGLQGHRLEPVNREKQGQKESVWERAAGGPPITVAESQVCVAERNCVCKWLGDTQRVT